MTENKSSPAVLNSGKTFLQFTRREEEEEEKKRITLFEEACVYVVGCVRTHTKELTQILRFFRTD